MIKINQKKLVNGLEVILIRNPNLSGIVATLFVRAGSAFESEEHHGISHLYEHLILARNRERKKHFPLNLELEARTRKDFTYYEISHHADYLEEIIKILFSAIFEEKISQQQLTAQKNAIIQEIHERDEDPFVVLSEEMEKNLYTKEWKKDVLGTEKSLAQINSEELEKWKKNFYQAGNMTLAVSGNFEQNKTLQLIEKEASKVFTVGEKFNRSILPALRYAKNFHTWHDLKKFDQAYLALAFPIASRIGEGQYFKALLLADLLAKKLEIELKNSGDFYDIDLYHHQYLCGGELRIITSLEKDKAEKSMPEIVEKTENIEWTMDFFEKIREFSAKSFLLRTDLVDELASLPLYHLAGNGKILSPVQESEQIMEIGLEEIIELKNKYIKRENCSSLILT